MARNLQAFWVFSQHPAWVITPVNLWKVWSIAYIVYSKNNKIKRVLETRDFTPAYTGSGHWTYVRTILSEPKFLGWIDTPIFLRESSAMTVNHTVFHTRTERWGLWLLTLTADFMSLISTKEVVQSANCPMLSGVVVSLNKVNLHCFSPKIQMTIVSLPQLAF